MSDEGEINGVAKGDRFDWNGVAIAVTRVAADGSWADLACVPLVGDPWRKRQRLPLPAAAVRVSGEEERRKRRKGNINGVYPYGPGDRERFWSKVDRSDPQACWDWTLARLPKGYGVFSVAGRNRIAHRVAYELNIGAIPAGMTLDHRCLNKGCVNPAHVEVVSRGENGRRGNIEARTYVPKTHCKRGHELTGDNVRLDRRGERHCHACNILRGRARYSPEIARQYAEMVVSHA